MASGFAATGGRASWVVVGVFFAQAAANGSVASPSNAAMVSVETRLFIPYSLARGRANDLERWISEINIAKTLRKPQPRRAFSITAPRTVEGDCFPA